MEDGPRGCAYGRRGLSCLPVPGQKLVQAGGGVVGEERARVEQRGPWG